MIDQLVKIHDQLVKSRVILMMIMILTKSRFLGTNDDPNPNDKGILFWNVQKMGSKTHGCPTPPELGSDLRVGWASTFLWTCTRS